MWIVGVAAKLSAAACKSLACRRWWGGRSAMEGLVEGEGGELQQVEDVGNKKRGRLDL